MNQNPLILCVQRPFGHNDAPAPCRPLIGLTSDKLLMLPGHSSPYERSLLLAMQFHEFSTAQKGLEGRHFREPKPRCTAVACEGTPGQKPFQ